VTLRNASSGDRVSLCGYDMFTALRIEIDDPSGSRLQPLLDESRTYGFNLWRVFGQASRTENGYYDLRPTEPGYYQALDRLAKRLTAKLAVQLFKLSHHGSRQNVTPELLDLIEPERVLVCTDGSQYNHPDEDALELVRKHYPGVPIIFSDDTPVTQERAAQLGATGPSSFSPTIKLPPAQ